LVMTSGRRTYLSHVAMQGAEEKYIKVLVWKPEGQRLLGRPRHRWEGSIKMCLRKYEGRAWNRFICCSTGGSGGLLWTQWWTFGFCNKMWVASGLASKEWNFCLFFLSRSYQQMHNY
jgi:hypothetical protein